MLQINLKKRCVYFVACMLLLGTVSAQTRNEFSVKQCVDYGLKNSVQVKNALLDIKLQLQTNKGITSAAYPHLNANFSANHYFNIPVMTTPNFISQGTYGVLTHEGVKNGSGSPIVAPTDFGTLSLSFTTPWNAGGEIDLSQIIFDGQVFVGLKARKSAMDFATKTAEVTSEQIKGNIYKIYYQLAVGKKQLESVDANIERFNKLLFDTKEMYKNGFVEMLDVNRVQVTISNLSTEKEKLENQLSVGNAGLKFLMNMPQKDSLVLVDTISETELKSNVLDTAYNYNDRKEIQMLNTLSKLNEYNVRRYRLSQIPTVAAFGSYGKNAQRTELDFFNKGEWFTTSLVGIKVSIPIFNGFATASNIESAKLSLQKTKNTIESAKRQMDYEVSNSVTKMKSAILTVDNQKLNSDLAEKVYYSTKKKYEQGLGSNMEIYNAQTELKTAQTSYYSALYDAVIAKIDYLLSVGKL
jgi:outer membrane protein